MVAAPFLTRSGDKWRHQVYCHHLGLWCYPLEKSWQKRHLLLPPFFRCLWQQPLKDHCPLTFTPTPVSAWNELHYERLLFPVNPGGHLVSNLESVVWHMKESTDSMPYAHDTLPVAMLGFSWTHNPELIKQPKPQRTLVRIITIGSTIFSPGIRTCFVRSGIQIHSLEVEEVSKRWSAYNIWRVAE